MCVSLLEFEVKLESLQIPLYSFSSFVFPKQGSLLHPKFITYDIFTKCYWSELE